MSDTAPWNVAILVFDHGEILDFAGPYEVLVAAGAFDQSRGFNVFTVAQHVRPVTLTGGLVVMPQHSFDDHPPIDILIVPGGYMVNERKNKLVLDWIRRVDGTAEIVTSVCTGAFLLGDAGLLTDRDATTYWNAIDTMKSSYPDVQVLENVRFVDAGHVVTSAGVSAGIDMALHLVERLCGRDAATNTGRYMEYDWRAAREGALVAP